MSLVFGRIKKWTGEIKTQGHCVQSRKTVSGAAPDAGKLSLPNLAAFFLPDKKPLDRERDKSEPLSITKIGMGAVVCGSVNSPGEIVVSGQIDGDISSEGRVTVKEQGNVIGNIKCGSALIRGRVLGDVEAWGMLQLDKKAVLSGNIKADSLKVQSGAFFEGSSMLAGREGVGDSA